MFHCVAVDECICLLLPVMYIHLLCTKNMAAMEACMNHDI